MLTNETGRPIIVTFELGDKLIVQPFRSFDRNVFEKALGKIKEVRFKK